MKRHLSTPPKPVFLPGLTLRYVFAGMIGPSLLRRWAKCGRHLNALQRFCNTPRSDRVHGATNLHPVSPDRHSLGGKFLILTKCDVENNRNVAEFYILLNMRQDLRFIGGDRFFSRDGVILLEAIVRRGVRVGREQP